MKKNAVRQLKSFAHMEHLIRPDTEWVQRNREQLLSQISNTVAGKTQAMHWATRAERFSSFFIPRQVRSMFRPAASLLGIIVLTASGWIASASAEPGDTLYSTKIFTEEIQVFIAETTGDQESVAKQHLKNANKRMEELPKVIHKNELATETVKKLHKSIESAQNSLDNVKTKDTDAALVLAKDVTKQTNDLAATLKEVTQKAENNDATLVKEVAETTKVVNETGLKAIEVVLQDKQTTATQKEEVKTLVQEKINLLVGEQVEVKAAAEVVKQTATSTLVNTPVAITTTTLLGVNALVTVPALTAVTSSVIVPSTTKSIITTTTSATIQPVAPVVKDLVKNVDQTVVQAEKVAKEATELLKGDQLLEAVQKAKTLNDINSATKQTLVETITKVQPALLPQSSEVK